MWGTIEKFLSRVETCPELAVVKGKRDGGVGQRQEQRQAGLQTLSSQGHLNLMCKKPFVFENYSH